MVEPVTRAPSLRVAKTAAEDASRLIPEEVPVALVYDGSTHAVMMATPSDLEDFALGFSLTEGIVRRAADIREIDIVEHENGLEARIWLVPETGRAHADRRRRLAGPTACGLCGVESLDAAIARPPSVGTGATATPDEIQRALAAMPAAQTLNIATRAVHAAGFWSSASRSLVALREDVGRHNALDKLVGSLARLSVDPAKGFVVLTSRVSVEMVQKTARLGAEILVAVSAPTALALRTADEAGITIVAIARPDAFEIFTHPERIALAKATNACFRPGDHLNALV